MSKLTKKAEKFLHEYHNNWLDYITPYVDETYTDKYGTAVGVINPGQEFKVVIEAHADENPH